MDFLYNFWSFEKVYSSTFDCATFYGERISLQSLITQITLFRQVWAILDPSKKETVIYQIYKNVFFWLQNLGLWSLDTLSASMKELECSERAENIMNRKNTIFYIEAILNFFVQLQKIFFLRSIENKIFFGFF